MRAVGAPSFQAPVTLGGGTQPEQGRGWRLGNTHSALVRVPLQPPTEPPHGPEPTGSGEPRAPVDLVHRAHPGAEAGGKGGVGWEGPEVTGVEMTGELTVKVGRPHQ